jgi:hypothetical protein
MPMLCDFAALLICCSADLLRWTHAHYTEDARKRYTDTDMPQRCKGTAVRVSAALLVAALLHCCSCSAALLHCCSAAALLICRSAALLHCCFAADPTMDARVLHRGRTQEILTPTLIRRNAAKILQSASQLLCLLLPCCIAAFLLRCSAALLLCCFAALLLCRCTADVLLCCTAALLFCYIAALLHCRCTPAER